MSNPEQFPIAPLSDQGHYEVSASVCLVASGSDYYRVRSILGNLANRLEPYATAGVESTLTATPIHLPPELSDKRYNDFLAAQAVLDDYRDSIGLSGREAEVMDLLVQGYSYRDVATKLNIQPATVKNHHYNIGRKMGTGDRVRMAYLYNGLHLGTVTSEA